MAPQNNDVGTAGDSSPQTPKAKPSDKQMNILAIIMQNVEGQPKINWMNVAAQAGFKNERVAKETYRQMCKKFGWNKGGSTASTPGGNSSVETPTKVTKMTGKIGSGRKPRVKKAVTATGDEGLHGVIEDPDMMPYMSGALQDHDALGEA